MGTQRNNPDLPAITGDCLKLIVKISGKDRPSDISFGYMSLTFAGAGLAADVTSFAAAWQAVNEVKLSNVLPATSTIFEYDVQAVSRNDVRTGLQLATTVGTVTGVSLAQQVAAVIVRGTATKGQHGRGRVMMPDVPASFVTPATDPNLINATGVTAYTTFLQSVFGTTAPPAITVNGRQYYPAILQTPPKGPNLVTKAQVVGPVYCFLDDVLGTVRNRIRRRR